MINETYIFPSPTVTSEAHSKVCFDGWPDHSELYKKPVFPEHDSPWPTSEAETDNYHGLDAEKELEALCLFDGWGNVKTALQNGLGANRVINGDCIVYTIDQSIWESIDSITSVKELEDTEHPLQKIRIGLIDVNHPRHN